MQRRVRDDSVPSVPHRLWTAMCPCRVSSNVWRTVRRVRGAGLRLGVPTPPVRLAVRRAVLAATLRRTVHVGVELRPPVPISVRRTVPSVGEGVQALRFARNA